MKKVVAGLAALAVGATLAPAAASADRSSNIVDIVLDVSGTSGFDSNGSDYDLLREALLATDLAGAVATTDDITVFAPTDTAFIRTARDLGFEGSDEAGAFGYLAGFTGYKSAAKPGLLDDVLLYHVAPDADTVRQLRRSGRIATLQGGTVRVVWNQVIDADRNDRNARIVRPKNLRASNGIIQTVNRVLRPIDLEPPAPDTVVDVVLETSGASGFDRNALDFDILREALTATDLVGAVQSASDINVFAPADAAFIALARELGYDGFSEAGAFAKIAEATGYVSAAEPGILADVLLYHVAPEARTISQLRSAGAIPTLLGPTIDVGWFRIADQDTDDRNPLIGFPRNIETGNGNVHTILGVLRPVDLP
jgi:uncharacterized surface protein with fasciclin (FAS1) repeats